jgi:hypothetical protein
MGQKFGGFSLVIKTGPISIHVSRFVAFMFVMPGPLDVADIEHAPHIMLSQPL